jgi:pseudaminic acid biosynthesis-associated methylase
MNNEQEAFWAGEFGAGYIQRNRSEGLLAANLALFSRALQRAGAPRSCLELGANIGLNLSALQSLFPGQEQHAVEINAEAHAELCKVLAPEHAWLGPIADFPATRTWELVLTKTVLIHINPEQLPAVYDRIHALSSRWILIAEYYNPAPVAIPYRGHSERLYKRDFAGDLLQRFPSLRLVDYGFVYHGDPAFPQDDITWFLLEKR